MCCCPTIPPPSTRLGDGVNNNDVAFGTSFPYVGLPHTPAVNTQVGAAKTSAPPPILAPSTGEGGTATAAASLPVVPIGLGAGGVLIATFGLGASRPGSPPVLSSDRHP